MIRNFLCIAVICWTAQAQAQPPQTPDLQPWMREYEQAFASGDAVAASKFWATDAVWTDANGEKVTGREAIQNDLAQFFTENPQAKLIGNLQDVQQIAPTVLAVEGETRIVLSNTSSVAPSNLPIPFSAIVIQEGDRWVLSRIQERTPYVPATPRVALTQLEFLLGTWQDEIVDAKVTTQVRWSEGESFLLRSFTIEVAGETLPLRGTEVIGWDPVKQQIRSWRFDSDGSFGQGTWLKDGDSWLGRMQQTFADGSQGTSLVVVRTIDVDTLEVSTVGQEINGTPQPTSDPIRVKRVLPETASQVESK